MNIESIYLFVFDFDGVLTNNAVYISSENDIEFVKCNRSDGLAFDVIRKIGIKTIILSSEKNPVVQNRAKKLKIQALSGTNDKVASLDLILKDLSFNYDDVFYVGNDINDLNVMLKCKYSACPSDSHALIKEKATFMLKSAGGEGVFREILEDIFHIDTHSILYK